MVQTVYINMNEEMAAELESRASSMHMPVNQYIELVLLDMLEYSEPEITLRER